MHPLAFGSSIPSANLDKFLDYSNKALAAIDFGSNRYDINFSRISEESDIENLILDIGSHKDLWAQGNSEPLIEITRIPITAFNVQIMGSKQDTVKIEYNGISYIQFRATELIEELQNSEGKTISVVGRANINEWGGRRKPQLFIENYEIYNIKGEKTDD